MDELTREQIARSEDTGALWHALQEAKSRQDHRRVRAIENRMRELGDERRFAHLTDDEVAARIRAIAGNREPEDVLAYSPASGEGYEGASDTAALNRAIRANQHDRIEATLGALLAERERRQEAEPGAG